MFRRVLVANRGEIAARIVRACDALGVESVVAFSEADREAPWVRRATRAICIGPAAAADSYLNQSAILQAAEQSDCQAVHPGYGFLAENALFAARCEQQGLTFVGPPASAIRRMGDKAAAKRAFAAKGLPTIPGSDGLVRDVPSALEVAARVGYPVLVKAVAGGGGKGMRRADDEPALRRGFDEARLEAEKAFGEPALYLEKLVLGARHVEFQILVDAAGRTVHLGERECSVQRQHQKLAEESPSPVVDAATRDEVGRRVARAVAELGYRNAGTVEFLRGPDGSLFFMEMNTRLQVEHPVTEMVTGVDLVAEQLRIAANQPLTIAQDEVALAGHALELRINAEDADHGFRPDPGRIAELSLPLAAPAGARLRWESAIETGWRIPPHYDSLIGKLVVHAASRGASLAAARAALAELRIGGVATTIGFHRRLLDDASFVAGDYDLTLVGRMMAATDAPARGGRG